MIKFVKYILLRIIIVFSVLWLLDFFFTSVYTKTSVVRNKVQYIFKSNTKTYDYVFLGSSRVQFHINTRFIDSITHKKSLNLGISGQDLSETFLTLKMLVKNNFNINQYFIQVDETSFSSTRKKEFISSSYFMPYVKNGIVKNHLKENDKDFYLDYYLPFYRYMNYNPKIGYRELLLTLGNKKRAQEFYIGLHQLIENKKSNYIFRKNYQNQLLEKIKKFSKKNNLDITFFTSPYYQPKETKEYQYFAKSNNIFIYIDSLQSPNNYKDLTHLNYIGARKFTKMLIRDFNLNE